MELFKPLRSLVPELLDSPTLTRVGRIQRAVLTGLLIILPILHAAGQRFHNLSRFECTISGRFASVERKASDEATTFCHEEYLRNFPIAYLEFFLVFMWLHLLVLWLYSSYVSDRLELWRALLKAKDHKHKRAELKSLSRVFTAYISQLCIRFALSVIFLVFHVWSSAIFAPSRFDCNSSGDRDMLFTTRANCKNGHASEIVFVNNAILLLAVLCAVFTLLELHHVWRTSELSGRSDYYFCLLLLRENEVPGTKYLIERELFIEGQRTRILAASRLGVQAPFPSFSPSNFKYIPVDMFIRCEKTKQPSSKKFLKEEFRSYAKTTVIKLDVLGEMFKPGIKTQAMTPKRILVTGEGGIGKTTLVSEIVRKWMEESGDINFTFAFFFPCVHMSLLKEDMTLKDLLERSMFSGRLHEKVFSYILKHPESVLLVFDGLDELDADAVCATTRRQKQKDETLHKLRLPSSEWYLELAGGYILPEATVLTTARTSGALMENLEHLLIPDRKIELRGFMREQVEEYVQNFFESDAKMAEEVNKIIFENCTLEALCYTPIYCFLTCLCLRNFVEGGLLKFGTILPSTMTEVCERVIDIFLHMQHAPNHSDTPTTPAFVGQFSDEMKIALNSLSLLAMEAIQEDKRVFTRHDLDTVCLSEGQIQLLEQTGFLRSVPAVADSAKQFCFNHTVIQEFLAARRIAMKFSHSDILALLENVDERHYLILQFVAGLCNQEDGEEGETMMARMIEEFVEAQVQETGMSDQAMIDCPLLPFFCTCLFEDKSTLKRTKAVKSFQANHVIFANVQVPIYNLLAVFHVLGHVPTVLKLTLQNCNLGDDGFRLLLPSICNKDSSLENLSLQAVGLTDAGVLALLDSAASGRSFPLKVLNLRGNSISCDGARHLACLLFNDWCELEEVYLGKNKIGHLGVNYLGEALCGDNCKVHTLDISANGLASRAMGSLSNALSTASCNVKTLYLMQNKLGDTGFGHLCEALSSDDCRLHVVLVSGNGITDRGVRFLRKPLSNTSCKLQELYLGFNQITDDGVRYLVGLLSTYWSYLRVLSLASNPLSDKGVNLLAGALRFNTCNLERLHISITRTIADKRGSRLQVRYV